MPGTAENARKGEFRVHTGSDPIVLRGLVPDIMGCNPKWDANPSAKDKTIALFHKTDLSNPEKVEEALDWLVQQTIIFYNVFSKEVKGIK